MEFEVIHWKNQCISLYSFAAKIVKNRLSPIFATQLPSLLVMPEYGLCVLYTKIMSGREEHQTQKNKEVRARKKARVLIASMSFSRPCKQNVLLSQVFDLYLQCVLGPESDLNKPFSVKVMRKILPSRKLNIIVLNQHLKHTRPSFKMPALDSPRIPSMQCQILKLEKFVFQARLQVFAKILDYILNLWAVID